MPGGHTTYRPHGYACWAGEGRNVEADALQCCHCAAHFWVSPGSGKVRGFCLRCSQVTCGAEVCNPCVHWKQRLENKEQGRPLDYRPITANVTHEPPKSAGGIILGKK